MNTTPPPSSPSDAKPAFQSHYRAWKFEFIHPPLRPQAADFDPRALELDSNALEPSAPDQPAGLQLMNGKLQMISGAEAVRQSILLLLSTRPGERVMLPEYGCELYRLAFAPNDDMTAGLAIHYIRQAVERWEPRAEITNLDAGRDPDAPERLNINLEYRLRATQQVDQFYFSLDLTGGNP